LTIIHVDHLDKLLPQIIDEDIVQKAAFQTSSLPLMDSKSNSSNHHRETINGVSSGAVVYFLASNLISRCHNRRSPAGQIFNNIQNLNNGLILVIDIKLVTNAANIFIYFPRNQLLADDMI
jgi:hypothetical protein